MFNQSCGRKSLNLSLIGNIQITKNEIMCRWIRGITIAILIFSIIIYIMKSIFVNITSEIFTIKPEASQDFPSSDSTNRNYSFNFSYINEKSDSIINDYEFILKEKEYGTYLNNLNLTFYETYKNKRKNEFNYIYKLFKFNENGEESSILIDYSSSLPHFPLFAKDNDKCFIRGEIISRLNKIVNLTCIDISGIIHDDFNFIVRLALLDKASSDIKLFIFKEISIQNEIRRKDDRHNLIFYEKNDTKKNIRYCSKELLFITQSYKNIPKNFIPVIEINWANKTQYFCLRNIKLFYEAS